MLMGRTRPISAAAALALVVCTCVAGCDPGTTSNDIGLGRDPSGQLVALVNMCESPLSKIEVGAGSDRSADAAAVISPVDPMSGVVVVPLAEPGEAFEVKKGADFLSDPSVPFFISADTNDGTWGDQVFSELPEPGMALFSIGTTSEPSSHPIEEFAANAQC
ncbi:hypothetical protein [Cellulomonas sp. URHB0016]